VNRCGPRAGALAGILNVNKPGRMTSHDVVNTIRRLSGQRRIGHAGTLDPMATGVLIVCAGWATRLSEYLMEGRKRYRATVRFGVSTDTYDADGAMVGEERPVALSGAELRMTLAEYEGVIEQTAPAYSAVKQDGVPLYRLARRGDSVNPPVRRVEIHELTLLEWNSPAATLDVVCSKGTYIRSLAHDLGERFGCGAHLTALVRTASGPFRLEDAASMTDLAEAFAAGDIQRLVYPLGLALPDMAIVTVDVEQQARIQHGQYVEGLPSQPGRNLALGVSAAGELLAILRYQVEQRRWQPTKVFS
jgi:tRNA pseudouridine55 synthase